MLLKGKTNGGESVKSYCIIVKNENLQNLMGIQGFLKVRWGLRGAAWHKFILTQGCQAAQEDH